MMGTSLRVVVRVSGTRAATTGLVALLHTVREFRMYGLPSVVTLMMSLCAPSGSSSDSKNAWFGMSRLVNGRGREMDGKSSIV